MLWMERMPHPRSRFFVRCGFMRPKRGRLPYARFARALASLIAAGAVVSGLVSPALADGPDVSGSATGGGGHRGAKTTPGGGTRNAATPRGGGSKTQATR